MKPLIISFVVISILVGCTTAERAARRQLDFISYTKSNFPPQPKDYPIDLYFEAKPQRGYEVIGQVTGFIVHDYNFRPVLEEKIRQVGGDGAIDIEIGTGHRTSSSSGYRLNVFTNRFETVTNVGSYKVINLKGKVIKYEEMTQRDIPKGLEDLQSTWTEQEKYAFNIGRAASLGRAEASLKDVTGLKRMSRAARESEEVFTLYKDSPAELEGLHLMYEAIYDDFLNPNKAIIPKKLEAIISNISLFLFDLGWAYDTGVLNAFLKTPKSPRSERDKAYPFDGYQDDSTALEQLHWAFEWGYIHGKTYLLPKKD